MGDDVEGADFVSDEGTAVKRLRIEYAGSVLFDADVDELTWTDSAGGVSVTGKFKSAGGKGVGDLLAGLAGARKQQTLQDVARRRQELEKGEGE